MRGLRCRYLGLDEKSLIFLPFQSFEKGISPAMNCQGKLELGGSDIFEERREISGEFPLRELPVIKALLQFRSRKEDSAEDEIRQKKGPENVKELSPEEGAGRPPSAHPEKIHKTSFQTDAGEGHRKPPGS